MTLDKTYWLEHGATYIDEFKHGPAYAAQEAALLEALAGLKFDTVLEVGCGFGRITRLVYDAFKPRAYLATDVSQDALNNAAKYCEGREIQFRLRDLDSFGATPRYDLVICAEVLMHRTPLQLGPDCSTLLGLSSRYIVNVDWYEPEFKGDAPGCYQHPYSVLFENIGQKLGASTTQIMIDPIVRQSIWLTTREAGRCPV